MSGAGATFYLADLTFDPVLWHGYNEIQELEPPSASPPKRPAIDGWPGPQHSADGTRPGSPKAGAG